MRLGQVRIDRIQFLHEYGPLYLSTDESQAQRRVLLKQLYREFALGAIHLRGRKYWSFQKRRLEAAECPIEPARVAGAVLAKIADLLLNPKKSIEKIMVRGRTTQTTQQGTSRSRVPPQSGEALSRRC